MRTRLCDVVFPTPCPAGRLPECEGLYRQALALCPAYPSTHYNLGVLASERRRWSEALQHYKDTLARAPHHAQVRALRQRCASQQQRQRVVLRSRAARTLQPSNAQVPGSALATPRRVCVPGPQALCNSGVVYREIDRLHDAVAAYEAALAVRRRCRRAQVATPRRALHCGWRCFESCLAVQRLPPPPSRDVRCVRMCVRVCPRCRWRPTTPSCETTWQWRSQTWGRC
jgi:tetratricopeptide (TPR) repeat protein